MAVLSEPFLDNTSYSFDGKTGAIAPMKDYKGTNILIKLKLDKSKANPEKAAEYLDKLNKSEQSSDNTGKTESNADTKEIIITQDMIESAKLESNKK